MYYQKHFGKYITSRDHAYIAKLQSITSICHIIVIRFPSSIAWYGYYSILREIFFSNIPVSPLRSPRWSKKTFPFAWELPMLFRSEWCLHFSKMRIFINERQSKKTRAVFQEIIHLFICIATDFLHQGYNFFWIFLRHFVENSKLHNIYKVQSGVSWFHKMAADILLKIER